MKNHEKAQFITEQLEKDGFNLGNAFFGRLEIALDKLDAVENDPKFDGDWTCPKCDELNGARRKTCRICDCSKS